MKAITIHQPYASLIAIGAKRYETRRWCTNYRGPIAVHAGKAPLIPHKNLNLWRGIMGVMGNVEITWREPPLLAFSDNSVLFHDQFPLGAIVATAELAGCYRIEMSSGGDIVVLKNGSLTQITITGNELLFGDYTPGRYAWELANVQPLPEPVPCRGKQGLWNWETESAT